MKRKHRVYVACSLTHAPEEFKQFVETVKQELRSFCDVLCFKDADQTNFAEIYDHCIARCVGTSDLVVAICDLPAIGLGMEIATQIEGRQQPCLMLAAEGSQVTDIIIEIPRPNCFFLRYRPGDVGHIVQIVQDKLSKIPIETDPEYVTYPTSIQV